MTTYELAVSATCPNDTEIVDRYDVKIETGGMIAAERILAAVDALVGEPIYQEHLTRQLADALKATVTTVGMHSGVLTTCSCS